MASIRAVMPKGVEHTLGGALESWDIFFDAAVMPQGVEHLYSSPSTVAGGSFDSGVMPPSVEHSIAVGKDTLAGTSMLFMPKALSIVSNGTHVRRSRNSS